MEYLVANLITNNFDGVVQSLLLQPEPGKSEPILAYLDFLKTCTISNNHLKLYYQFATKLLYFCAQYGIRLRQHVANSLFYFNYEFVINQPVIGTNCATEYVRQCEKPSDDELVMLTDQYIAKLAESIENEAPQMAYIKFLSALNVFMPLRVIISNNRKHWLNSTVHQTARLNASSST